MDKNVVSITKRDTYNAEMAKSAYDKLGFVNEIFEPISAIIDFGCADGSVTRLMRTFYDANKTIIVGYDLAEIIDNRLENDYDNNIGYTSLLSEVNFAITEWLKDHPGKVLLVMNSVLHEVYNYMSPVEIKDLYSTLFSTINPDYIWVRDMFIHKNFSIFAHREGIVEAVKNYLNDSPSLDDETRKRFNDFNHWNQDSCLSVIDITHFLMKYTYRNWDKEVKEDYAILTRNNYSNYNDFVRTLTFYDFKIVKEKDYVLPFLEYKIKQEMFDISISQDLGMYTHKWVIFKRED